MTTGMWIWYVASILMVSTVLGLGLFFYLSKGEYQRGVLDGEFQANLTHGWHPAVDADRRSVAHPRRPGRRSPNEQFVTRPFEPERSPRPVFDHPN